MQVKRISPQQAVVEAEVEALPIVQEYRQAEAATRRLFQVVDALIR
ncbi:MAG: hypothetical protein ACUVR4_13755 [Anaerolineae bacterium]